MHTNSFAEKQMYLTSIMQLTGITVKDATADFNNVVKRSRDVASGMSNGVQFLMK